MSDHSGMQHGGDPLVQQIYDWDDYVEDHDREQAVRPFDAGIMLATAKLIDVWDQARSSYRIDVPQSVLDAMQGLRETAEAIVEEGFLDPKDGQDQ